MAHIRIVTIEGSIRPNNYTAMALNLAVDELKNTPDVSVTAIQTASLKLVPPGAEGGDKNAIQGFQEAVKNATGIILSTPEYHGSYSSVIKLVIENLGFPSLLAGKPIALLGVAAGQIGAIKALEHLRSVCSHVGGIVLPGPVSVAGVGKLFAENGNCTDAAIEKRIRDVATALVDYIHNHICPKACLEAMVRD